MSWNWALLICLGIAAFAFLEHVRGWKIESIRQRVMYEFEEDRDDRRFARSFAIRVERKIRQDEKRTAALAAAQAALKTSTQTPQEAARAQSRALAQVAAKRIHNRDARRLKQLGF